MSEAACLLMFAIVIAMSAPRVLPVLTRSGSAPRLGVAVWLAVVATVVVSTVAAAALLVRDVAHYGKHFGSAAVDAEEAALRDLTSAHIGMHASLGVLALTVTAAVTLLWRTSRAIARYHHSAARHSRTIQQIGRTVESWNAVMVESTDRLAYCIAGPFPVIVISSAAADALDESHMRAVLAHEHAHLAGGHHRILASLRVLHQVFPRIRLFEAAHADTARLLEMCADDMAVRAYGSRDLLGAMIALTGPATTPEPALGSATVDVLARARRLARPVRTARLLWDRAALTTVTAVSVSPSTAALIAAFA